MNKFCGKKEIDSIVSVQPIHNYRTCEITDCPECQDLIDYDLICACDGCGYVGDKEALGWFYDQSTGRVLCDTCNDKENQQQ